MSFTHNLLTFIIIKPPTIITASDCWEEVDIIYSLPLSACDLVTGRVEVNMIMHIHDHVHQRHQSHVEVDVIIIVNVNFSCRFQHVILADQCGADDGSCGF